MLIIRLRCDRSIVAIHPLLVSWSRFQQIRAAIENCGRYVAEVK